jgi:hypothetical protein
MAKGKGGFPFAKFGGGSKKEAAKDMKGGRGK